MGHYYGQFKGTEPADHTRATQQGQYQSQTQGLARVLCQSWPEPCAPSSHHHSGSHQSREMLAWGLSSRLWHTVSNKEHSLDTDLSTRLMLGGTSHVIWPKLKRETGPRTERYLAFVYPLASSWPRKGQG